MINTIDTRIQLYDKLPKCGVGAELGVCRGSNAAHLYLVTKPRSLYLVDNWKNIEHTKFNHSVELHYDDWENDVKSLFSDKIGSDVFLHKGDTLSFLSIMPDRSLDWVYIDGDHMYDSIHKELNLAIKKVKIGGIISGHDFTFNTYWKSGVMRAIIEKIQLGNLKMEYLTNEEYPSYFCRVIK